MKLKHLVETLSQWSCLGSWQKTTVYHSFLWDGTPHVFRRCPRCMIEVRPTPKGRTPVH